MFIVSFIVDPSWLDQVMIALRRGGKNRILKDLGFSQQGHDTKEGADLEKEVNWPIWREITLCRVGACTCTFLPSYSSSVMLPFAWIKGSVAFPRGFPTRLSQEAFPQGCPTCHRGVSRSLAWMSRLFKENRIPWNGLKHLGDSGNGGTTLEFLSPFRWRAPPLEMRRERREFFPDHAGKGYPVSS